MRSIGRWMMGILVLGAATCSWAEDREEQGLRDFIGVIWAREKLDAPYCVTLDFGNVWATEYLSTANERWAEALANAIQEAMRQCRDPGGEGFILGQDRLRN